MMVGTGRGAQAGILIKGGAALETAHRTTAVVFDKTGTVTEGKPTVSEIIPSNGFTETDLLQVTASAERGSEHPLADAVVRAAQERGLTLERPDAFEAIPGRGLQATVAGKSVLVGTAKLLREHHIPVATTVLDRLATEGKTPLLIAINGQFAGIVSISDQVKATSKEAVARLKDLGLKVVMLTGDTQGSADAVARNVGIDHVIAEVLPEGKAKAITQLRAEGHIVAMVGDGVNDAPALAAADLGIAMGSGTDVALEAADVTLVRGDLRDVASAIALSKATMRTVRQNLFFAFAYNVFGIPIAAGVLYPATEWLLSPIMASAAMALSSVSVVTNALRLRGFTPTGK
jgi:Cu+-exporting ATPase